MKKLLILLLFPLMMFAQDSTLTGDVDCSGEINSQDASLILQFVTNVIDTLPCEANMTGLTPDQLQEIINLMSEQLNVNYTGGGSGNYPVMISTNSGYQMKFTDALTYCRELDENNYSDWFLPSLEQLLYISSISSDLQINENNALWTTTPLSASGGTGAYASSSFYTIKLNQTSSNALSASNTSTDNLSYCRCVRFGEGETSEGSSGSSNSSGSGSSILGSEQPISMIGPMYLSEDFPEFNHIATNNYNIGTNYGGHALRYFDALRFCNELNYDGFSDWHLPSLNQIYHYIVNNNSENIEIPNIANFEGYWEDDTAQFWTSTDGANSDQGSNVNTKTTIYIYINESITIWDGSNIDASNKLYQQGYQPLNSSTGIPCFCVR